MDTESEAPSQHFPQSSSDPGTPRERMLAIEMPCRAVQSTLEVTANRLRRSEKARHGWNGNPKQHGNQVSTMAPCVCVPR